MPTFFSVRNPLLLLVLLAGCGEGAADQESSASCTDYCEKSSNCLDTQRTEAEATACVDTCLNDIEDNCGNDLQPAANDKINECVDLACGAFWPCMVLEEAPTCFDFVETDRPVEE